MISSKNLEYSSSILSEKVITQMKNAIYKYYSGKFYHIKDLEIQYEYHNLDGLQNYAIYDVKKSDDGLITEARINPLDSDEEYWVEM